MIEIRVEATDYDDEPIIVTALAQCAPGLPSTQYQSNGDPGHPAEFPDAHIVQVSAAYRDGRPYAGPISPIVFTQIKDSAIQKFLDST